MRTGEQFERILAMLGESNKGISELKSAMQELTTTKEEFDAWKPDVERRVSDLQQVVTQLGGRVEQLVVKASAPSFGFEQPVTMIGAPPPMPATADLVAPSKEATSGPVKATTSSKSTGGLDLGWFTLPLVHLRSQVR